MECLLQSHLDKVIIGSLKTGLSGKPRVTKEGITGVSTQNSIRAVLGTPLCLQKEKRMQSGLLHQGAYFSPSRADLPRLLWEAISDNA